MTNHPCKMLNHPCKTNGSVVLITPIELVVVGVYVVVEVPLLIKNGR